jgi:hypothetical protein
MGMSTNLHANHVEKFRTNGHVTADSPMTTEPYAVIMVGISDGWDLQDITLFLTKEQLHELKLTVCKTDKAFKRYVEKQAALKEVNE